MSAPEEASAEMRQWARMMRDLYAALVAEGFTEPQALTLLSDTVAAAMRPPS